MANVKKIPTNTIPLSAANSKLNDLIDQAEKISLKAGMGLPAAAQIKNTAPLYIDTSRMDGQLLKEDIKNKMLPPSQAKRKKSAPCITEGTNIVALDDIKKAGTGKSSNEFDCWHWQTHKEKLTLEKLINIMDSTVIDDKATVILPSFVDHLPDYLDIMSKIVKQMPTVGTITSSQASCLINLALQTGIAYSHKLWEQHAPAAKAGYSAGARGEKKKEYWAKRVEEQYIKEINDRRCHKKSAEEAYLSVAKEYELEYSSLDCNKPASLHAKLRRWWFDFYPNRKSFKKGSAK